MTRTLVAGVGNVFFGDDGFGCEVARQLRSRPLPDGVAVVDFGIRGVHLAYELTSGYDAAIIVDAVARGGRAGTLYVIDPEAGGGGAAVADAHGIDLGAVFAMTRTLGAPPARMVVVGCEAGDLVERIGLSDDVNQAVDLAIALVQTLLKDGERAVQGDRR
ncbi:MAG: hybD [Myxococcales bacterium]|nr:hybD [Myxococcales bacterium]